jgi:hypothetical protein
MKHLSVISRHPSKAQGDISITAILAIFQGIIAALLTVLETKAETY